MRSTAGPRSSSRAERTDRAVARPSTPVRSAGLDVVVTTVASDAHTWNLVYVQLLIEEFGHRVLNLGPCVPDELLVSECSRLRPDLVVVSSVNGHGFADGLRLIGRLRAHDELAATPVVIGGKLGTSGSGAHERRDRLRSAGFDMVFEDGAGTVSFPSFLRRLEAGVAG